VVTSWSQVAWNESLGQGLHRQRLTIGPRIGTPSRAVADGEETTGDEQLTLDDTDWTKDASRRVANMAAVDALREGLKDRVAHTARQACSTCGTCDAYLQQQGTHEGVFCARCDGWMYWAPAVETGRKPRTVSNLRKRVSASQRARILNRDGGRCVLCGTSDGPLHIGHLLSVEDGLVIGTDNALLYDDANLAAMCETCNLGLRTSVEPRTYAAIMWRLLRLSAQPSVRS